MKARVSEKVEQSHVVQALRSVGARVYVIGRPPRRDAVHKGTGQTPGLPDVLAHLPHAPDLRVGAHELWVEVKARGGRLRVEQVAFRDFCRLAGIAHVVGGLDAVLLYMLQHGYLTETAHYRKAGDA